MYLRHFNENDYLELTKYYMPNLKEEQFKQIIREWNLESRIDSIKEFDFKSLFVNV